MQKTKDLFTMNVVFPSGIDVPANIIAVAAAASTPDS